MFPVLMFMLNLMFIILGNPSRSMSVNKGNIISTFGWREIHTSIQTLFRKASLRLTRSMSKPHGMFGQERLADEY